MISMQWAEKSETLYMRFLYNVYHNNALLNESTMRKIISDLEL